MNYTSVFYFLTDIFSIGVWKRSSQLQHPDLKSLARQLPFVALQSRQDKTVRNYHNGYLRWRRWASQYEEVQHLPADSYHIALYLMHLLNSSVSHAPVSLGFYSISWAHRMAGLSDPTSDLLPRLVREAANRILGHGDNQKKPISATLIRKIVDKFVTFTSSLNDLRTAALCLICFTGFLRFDEASKLRFCDIHFCNSFVKLFIESSKTDIFREGNWVFIAALGGNYCPVAILKKYLSKAGFAGYSDKYVFRAISRHKNIKKRVLVKSNSQISYNTIRSAVLNAFTAIGEDRSNFGTHSMRAGGASAAANGGVSDRLFRKHGRWLSERSKDRYVAEDLANKLFVSRNLGL